jgi:sulfur carrier protein ThiS
MADTDVQIRVIPCGGIERALAAQPARWTLAVAPGTTLAGVLAGLGVDSGLVGVASVGGRHVRLEATLESDCEIQIFPVFGGG